MNQKRLTVNPEHEEGIKKECLQRWKIFVGSLVKYSFIGGAGALLVQSTLKDLGYEVTLGQLALVQIPVAITALVVASVYFYLKEKKLAKKYYSGKGEIRWIF